jgi:hypothetical protein
MVFLSRVRLPACPTPQCRYAAGRFAAVHESAVGTSRHGSLCEGRALLARPVARRRRQGGWPHLSSEYLPPQPGSAVSIGHLRFTVMSASSASCWLRFRNQLTPAALGKQPAAHFPRARSVRNAGEPRTTIRGFFVISPRSRFSSPGLASNRANRRTTPA